MIDWRAFLFHRGPVRGEIEPPPTSAELLGIHAERLLNDPVLNLAFDRVERKLFATFKSSVAHDGHARERIHAEHAALSRLRQELMVFLGDKKKLDAEQKAKDAAEAKARERAAA